MKKTRFTDAQMVTILLEADEKSVREVAKKHGVSAYPSVDRATESKAHARRPDRPRPWA